MPCIQRLFPYPTTFYPSMSHRASAWTTQRPRNQYPCFYSSKPSSFHEYSSFLPFLRINCDIPAWTGRSFLSLEIAACISSLRPWSEVSSDGPSPNSVSKCILPQPLPWALCLVQLPLNFFHCVYHNWPLFLLFSSLTKQPTRL